MSASDSQLPPLVEPEYMSWPLEKLQQEYHKQRLQLLSTQIQLSDSSGPVQKAQRLIQALKECLEDE